MAKLISVEDIRAKEFLEVKHGYDKDQVDDFLDEIAQQTAELCKEIKKLNSQLDAANYERSSLERLAEELKRELSYTKSQLENAVKEAEEAKAGLEQAKNAHKEDSYNDPGYFKNLESTLRETLIIAQRNAESTEAAAKKTAADIIAAAEQKAAEIKAESDARLAEITAEYDKVKADGAQYVTALMQLAKQQEELVAASSLYTGEAAE